MRIPPLSGSRPLRGPRRSGPSRPTSLVRSIRPSLDLGAVRIDVPQVGSPAGTTSMCEQKPSVGPRPPLPPAITFGPTGFDVVNLDLETESVRTCPAATWAASASSPGGFSELARTSDRRRPTKRSRSRCLRKVGRRSALIRDTSLYDRLSGTPCSRFSSCGHSSSWASCS